MYIFTLDPTYGSFTLPETDSGTDSDSCPKQKKGVGI